MKAITLILIGLIAGLSAGSHYTHTAKKACTESLITIQKEFTIMLGENNKAWERVLTDSVLGD